MDAIVSGSTTVKPLIKDTPKEDKPPNKGQSRNTVVYTLCTKYPPKEDNLSTKDKMAGPKHHMSMWRFHCTTCFSSHDLS